VFASLLALSFAYLLARSASTQARAQAGTQGKQINRANKQNSMHASKPMNKKTLRSSKHASQYASK
jgi:hypothetical protein